MYHCPKCGEELNFDSNVFVNMNRQVLGCEACMDLEMVDAETVLDYVEE